MHFVTCATTRQLWMERIQTHFYVRISGGATVWHLGKMYLIGGYSIEYDVELKSFYQNPTNSGKCL